MSITENEANNWDESPHKPLKITAYLQTPVICDTDAFLPLDSVLAFHAYREAYGWQDFTLANKGAENLPHVRLPLRKIKHKTDKVLADRWYYSCSFAQWQKPFVSGVDFWNQRVDRQYDHLIDFEGKRGRIDTSAGRYKAQHRPVFYRHALSVSWYAMGEKAKSENLLRFCTNLGKKTSQGWGAVLRWEVEDFNADWSITGADGQLMRSVPTADQKTGTLYGVRPSYWNPRHQFRCLLPSVS